MHFRYLRGFATRESTLFLRAENVVRLCCILWTSEAEKNKKEKLVSTWFAPRGHLTLLSVRKKETPHRYANGSMLAGGLYHCGCICAVVLHPLWTLGPCVFTAKPLCSSAHVSVYVITSDSIALSNDGLFYSFLPTLRSSSVPVLCTCAFTYSMLVSLQPSSGCSSLIAKVHGCSWASLILHPEASTSPAKSLK